jgi:hypothetical protein
MAAVMEGRRRTEMSQPHIYVSVTTARAGRLGRAAHSCGHKKPRLRGRPEPGFKSLQVICGDTAVPNLKWNRIQGKPI